MISLLIDTNIWLDECFDTRAKHEQAKQLFLTANAKGANVLYAPHSSKDVFRLVQARIKNDLRDSEGNISHADALVAHQFAWSYLEHMSSVATAVACDASDVWVAKKQRAIHGEYEDNLLIAAAMRADATYLVTNDEKLLRHCPVAALDVDDALKYLDALEVE